jgi:hypothetical protein
MHPLWQNAAGSFANIIPSPGADTRLWYDSRDVPFLREDQKDAAEIQKANASTINGLIMAGFKPEAAITAVTGEDLSLLHGQHTGLMSVQLLPPMDNAAKAAAATPAPAKPAAAPATKPTPTTGTKPKPEATNG